VPDAGGGSKDSFGFLGRKLGPAPVWLWAALAVGAYYLYTKYKGGSSAAASGAQAIDPATGVTYAQEISDAQDQITQLQAQLNAQAQGQTAPPAPDVTNVTVNDQDTAPPPAKPPPEGPEPEALTAADYRDLAIQALRDKGIKNPTPQQIADEQNDIRQTVGLGKAKGPPPKGGGTDTGVTPPAPKAKRVAKPKRPAGVNPGGPARHVRPQPLKHPAQRGKAAA
jgi:hypothetical protein